MSDFVSVTCGESLTPPALYDAEKRMVQTGRDHKSRLEEPRQPCLMKRTNVMSGAADQLRSAVHWVPTSAPGAFSEFPAPNA
jgi:hypothetical protein